MTIKKTHKRPTLHIFLLITPPTPKSTLFPYTTLFRSQKGFRAPPGSVDRVVSRGRSRLQRWRQLRSEEHTSELQSRRDIICRLLLEKKINSRMIHKQRVFLIVNTLVIMFCGLVPWY